MQGLIFTGELIGLSLMCDAHLAAGIGASQDHAPEGISPSLLDQSKRSNFFVRPLADSPSIDNTAFTPPQHSTQQPFRHSGGRGQTLRGGLNLKLPILFGLLQYVGQGNVRCRPLPTSFSDNNKSYHTVDFSRVSSKQALRNWEREYWGYTYSVYNLSQMDVIGCQFVIWDKGTRAYTGTGVVSFKDGQDGITS